MDRKLNFLSINILKDDKMYYNKDIVRMFTAFFLIIFTLLFIEARILPLL